jgi:hypothetical protein
MNPRLKAQIRLELFRCAAAGDFPTYEDFYKQLARKQMKGRFPYQRHFDAIAKEERKLGYPDITFVVRRKDPTNPYPSQIDFRSAKPTPSPSQLKSLKNGTNRIIALYCPTGTANPY